MGGCISRSDAVERSIINNTSNGTGEPERHNIAPALAPSASAATDFRVRGPVDLQSDARRIRIMMASTKTAVTGQKRAQQSSFPEPKSWSDLPPEAIRNIADALSLSDLMSLSRTNKHAKGEVSDLFDLHKDIQDFNIGTDNNALNTIQNFCSNIARLPIHHQVLPLLTLAKKIDLLPTEQKMDGYLAVRAVSDHLPLEHQKMVFRTRGMANGRTNQFWAVDIQLDSLRRAPAQEKMNFFNTVMERIALLPPQQHAETLNDLFSTYDAEGIGRRSIIQLLPKAEKMTALEAIRMQSTRLPPQLRAAVLEKVTEQMTAVGFE